MSDNRTADERRTQAIIDRRAVRRGGRRKDDRIIDPATHRRRHVSLVVAAEYLEVDRKTLNKWLDEGLLQYVALGRRRKIAVTDLVEFLRRQKRVGKRA